MRKLTRRTVVRGSLGVVAAALVARPWVANAQAKTATAWWNQGFVPEEDASFKAMVAEYEKQSGNKIDYSLIPTGPLMQKIVSSLTSGDVPDIMSHDTQDATVIPQNAWKDKLVDMSDIVEPLKSQLHPTAYLASHYLQQRHQEAQRLSGPVQDRDLAVPHLAAAGRKGRAKGRSCAQDLGCVLELFQAGADKTAQPGHARRLFIGPASDDQRPGRRQQSVRLFPRRLRRIRHHHTGRQGRISTIPRSKPRLIKTISLHHHRFQGRLCAAGRARLGRCRRQQRLHAKQIVMDLDGTISTELAMIHDPEKYNDAVVMGLPIDNDGKPITSPLTVGGAIIPKGGKERQSRQGICQICDPAQGCGRLFEVRTGALAAGDTEHRQKRSVVDRSQGSAPSRLCHPGRARQDDAAPLRLQSRHVGSQRGANLGHGACQRHSRRASSQKPPPIRRLKHIGDILAKYPIAQA